MAEKDCYHFVGGERVVGIPKSIRGNVSGIRGNVSGIRGDVSGIRGDVSDIWGDVSGIRGDVSDIWGDVSDIQGDVSDDTLVASFTRVCPEEGAFIGWKKLRGGVIAQLLIPADARRLTAFGSRKCRAERVQVLALEDTDRAALYEGTSLRDVSCIYRLGETVSPDAFDPDPRRECSHGIHFFITRAEAERWRG